MHDNATLLRMQQQQQQVPSNPAEPGQALTPKPGQADKPQDPRPITPSVIPQPQAPENKSQPSV